MPYEQTPSFRFSSSGKTLFASFNNHPLKDSEGKDQEIHFSMVCESQLEAHLLREFLQDMEWSLRKHYFTEGYNAKKRKEQNWML